MRRVPGTVHSGRALTTTRTPLSATTCATRAAGQLASIGTYAAPACQTPNIAAIVPTPLAPSTPTTASAPTPADTSAAATAAPWPSNVPYVTCSPPPRTATASGARAACAATNSGTNGP